MKTHSMYRFFAFMVALLAVVGACRSQTLYDFGNLTAEEQFYMELINRARANPGAEGARLAATTDADVLSAYSFFTVDKVMMQSEFNALPVLPPLAPHASLTAAARGHSVWLLANATQSHDETNPANTPYTRMTAAGYTFSTAGENVYSYAKSVWYGHAGFQVDWGYGGPGGMQTGRGHRANIHNASFREIGVGVALGSNGGVGPQLVTQDFGARSPSPSLGVGVAYYDLNENNFYDIGEGISGLDVNVSGVSDFYCKTAIGGGWVVPVPETAAIRTVTFSGLNVNQTVSLTFPASANAKVDLKLTYAPPSITSPGSAGAGSPHTLVFTPVRGATGYKWNRWSLAPAADENCENTASITSTTTGTYSVLCTSLKQQGAASFHLENSVSPGASQSIQLNGLYYGQALSSISFQSRIRYATTAEQFKVQVKEEGGLAWQDVFSQTGSGTDAESAFNSRSAPLTSMAGKAFRVRFILSYTNGGSYYGGSSGDNMGWLIDAISFSNVSVLQNNVSQTLAGTSGSFTPSAGTYLMSVAPVISSRDFPASYQTLTVTAPVSPAITTHPASVTINSGGTATLTVAASGTSPTFQWYVGNSGDIASPVDGAVSASFTTPALTASRSYWVRASNGAGSANSNAATVTVLVIAPAITTHPASVTINSGGTATLTVAASGTSPTFQWYVGNSGDIASPVDAAVSASFTTPALTASKIYWVRASNGAGSANSNAATVTVLDPYSSWALSFESAKGLAPGTLSNNPSGDWDQDGRSNLIEYAFGTSPVLGNEPTPRMPVNSFTATHFVVRYQRDTALTNLVFTPQACPVLGNWKAPGQIGAPAGFTDSLISTVGTLETREAKIPLSSGSACFIRIQVTRQP